MAEVKPWEIPDKSPRAKQQMPWEIPDAKKPPGYVEDAAKGFVSGLVQGTIGLATFPQDVGNALGEGFGYALDRLLGYSAEQATERGAKVREVRNRMGLKPPSGKDVTAMVENNFGPLYQAQYVPGQYAQTLGQFAPGMVVGPGGVLQRVASGTTAAVGSESAGQITKGTAAEPYARLLGAFAGGVVPDVLRRVVTPFPVNAERRRLLDVMDTEGVDLTAGQRTGRDGLGYAESEIGGGAAARTMERQGEQLTAAALRRVGENADRTTPEVMNRAFTRIGNQFDDLARRNNLPPDAQIATDVAAAVTDYTSLVPAAAQPNAVRQFANDLLGVAQNGLSGAQYQAFRSRLTTLARGSSDPQLATVYRNMADALDDAMERSLATAGSPDLGAWQTVRNQYRNILVLEQAATSAGKQAAEGIVSPSALRNATVQRQGRRNYSRGDGDFADLSRAAEATMKPLPNSGTAGRQRAQQLGAGLSSALGAAAGGHYGGGVGALLGLIGGGAIPYAAGRALMSRPVQAYLANQLAPGRGAPLAQRGIIPLLGVAPQITGPRQ